MHRIIVFFLQISHGMQSSCYLKFWIIMKKALTETQTLHRANSFIWVQAHNSRQVSLTQDSSKMITHLATCHNGQGYATERVCSHINLTSWEKLLKKRSERRKHCVLAVVRRSQKFSLHHRPLLRGAGRPKFNQLETVITFTYRHSLVKIDACNFELSW